MFQSFLGILDVLQLKPGLFGEDLKEMGIVGNVSLLQPHLRIAVVLQQIVQSELSMVAQPSLSVRVDFSNV